MPDPLPVAKISGDTGPLHDGLLSSNSNGSKAIKGAASGGLATLVDTYRHIGRIPRINPGPHWKEGRWQHTGVEAGETTIHVFNSYGWPLGTTDLVARQRALWLELVGQVATLGNAPW
eukprot:4580543-Heterocapsa_arctica.AAC.1